MGSLLSPILADLIQDLECSIFETLIIHVPFYYRYVNDIIIAIPNEHINIILCSFNSYHERIKFMVEYGDNGIINFLDVKLLIENGRIIFDNYRKLTNSGRYLNYFSNHPVEHKRGIVIDSWIEFYSFPI